MEDVVIKLTTDAPHVPAVIKINDKIFLVEKK